MMLQRVACKSDIGTFLDEMTLENDTPWQDLSHPFGDAQPSGTYVFVSDSTQVYTGK